LQPRAQFSIAFDRKNPPHFRQRVGLFVQPAFQFGRKIGRHPSIPARRVRGKYLFDGVFLLIE
jgi:hypothetical protein